MLIDSLQAIDDSAKNGVEECLSKILARQTLNYSSMQSNEPKLSLTQSIMPEGGGGTPILDLTGCAAQQGVLLR